MATQTPVVALPEAADGSGPSGIQQRAKDVERAIKRVSKASSVFEPPPPTKEKNLPQSSKLTSRSRELVLGLHAIFNHLGVESLQEDDETASVIWRENREEFKTTLIQIYDASDKVVDTALRTEKHLTSAQHDNMMRSVLFVRRLVMELLPQELYDRVVGKGKELKGKGKA